MIIIDFIISSITIFYIFIINIIIIIIDPYNYYQYPNKGMDIVTKSNKDRQDSSGGLNSGGRRQTAAGSSPDRKPLSKDRLLVWLNQFSIQLQGKKSTLQGVSNDSRFPYLKERNCALWRYCMSVQFDAFTATNRVYDMPKLNLSFN